MLNKEKLFLIFKREYLTRIRTKSFIISTLLAPLAIMLLIAIPLILALTESEQRHIIGVRDQVGYVAERFVELNEDRYQVIGEISVDSLRSLVLSGTLDGYIIINEQHITSGADVELIYTGSGGIGLISDIRSDVRNVIQNVRLDRAEVGPVVREILDQRAQLRTRKITPEGEETQDTLALFMIGYIMCFIIYGAMFGYGAIIMRSVIEEKTSRIIEVITSSVKPFELLMGKVLGVGALGLTQFTIWTLSAAGLMAIAGPVAAMVLGGRNSTESSGVQGMDQSMNAAAELPFEIPAVGIDLWISFILFFLFGYLIYSAMFAAIGSAVDSESDSQQFMLPVMVPIILPMLFLGKVASDPDSTFSVITSFIPFFAPMLMPVRIAMSSVPILEIVAALAIMLLTFIALIWISSRIYRVGILMYGKKVNFKEMAKWIRYS